MNTEPLKGLPIHYWRKNLDKKEERELIPLRKYAYMKKSRSCMILTTNYIAIRQIYGNQQPHQISSTNKKVTLAESNVRR